MKVSNKFLVIVAAGMMVIATIALLCSPSMRYAVAAAYHRLQGRVSLTERLGELTPAVTERLQSSFETAGVGFPPREVALLVFKDVWRLDLYCRDDSQQPWKFIKAYPVLGMSGTVGPKRVEGDRQVPEGIYGVEGLNPNSRFHVSLRLDYPNAFDRHWGAEEGRTRLGSDIMIHGGSASIGCLAMGDPAAEDLFTLAAHASSENVRVMICPMDFRTVDSFPEIAGVPWASQLYAELKVQLEAFCECN